VGGSPAGTVTSTTDDAWRSAFESVFLGAIRLARVLAADLGAGRPDDAATAALTGTGGSIAFVLAASVRASLPELAIPDGLFPGLAGVVKTLADEHGPSGIRINGLLPVGSPPTGSASSTPSAATPTRCAPASRSTSRCAGTANPRNSAALPHSCCPRPRPTSPAR